MTPEQIRAMYRRARLLGILTMADLCAILEVSDDTITRAVKRGDFPPPVSVFRHPTWRITSIKKHYDQLMEQARLEAEREQARRDTKVQSLYGGEPHGRRH